MLDKDQFSRMRNDAVIINIARGKLINEQILIKYLTDKKIGGAALDVFEEEPIKNNNKLLELENVLLTPHNASSSKMSDELSFKMSFDEIVRIVNKKKPLYKLNWIIIILI